MRPDQTDLGKPAVTTALLTLLSAVAYVVSILTWFLIIFGYTKYFASYHSLPACSFCLLVESVFAFGSFVGMGKFSISCLLTLRMLTVSSSFLPEKGILKLKTKQVCVS